MRNWLNIEAELRAPGPSAVFDQFGDFMSVNYLALKARGYSDQDIRTTPHRRTDRRHGALGRGEPGVIPSLDDIRDAAGLIAGVVLRTPFLPAPRLSALTGAEVFVKYENLQATSSFKERGALVKLLSLSPAERGRGVDRDVGGQPCPGGRLSCAAARHPGDDRHAEADALREDRGDARLRRRRCSSKGETLVEAQASGARIASETGAIARPSL